MIRGVTSNISVELLEEPSLEILLNRVSPGLYQDFQEWLIRNDRPDEKTMTLAAQIIPESPWTAEVAYKITAIEWAARIGHATAIETLFACDSVTNILDQLKNSPIIGVAAQDGHAKVVKSLLADGRVNPAAGDNLAIRLAAQRGHAEVVKLLLADGRVNPAAMDNYAIRLAVQNGHAKVAQLLLADNRVNPAADNNFAMRVAAQNGLAEVVKLLLADNRVNPAADNNFAMRAAAIFGHAAVVKLLLDDGRADPADINNFAMRVAAQNGHLATIAAILQYPGQAAALEAINPKIMKQMRVLYSDAISTIDCLIKLGLPTEVVNLITPEYNPVTKGFQTECAGHNKLIVRCHEMARLSLSDNKPQDQLLAMDIDKEPKNGGYKRTREDESDNRPAKRQRRQQSLCR